MESVNVKMTDREVGQALAAERGWRREGEELVRELQLRNFDEALSFLDRLTELASDYGRCPDMWISRFNGVRLSISNPEHAGFTLQEMRLAAKVNAVIEGHHPEAWEAS
jgi:pterin-4a-carbinolamine dehydratase